MKWEDDELYRYYTQGQNNLEHVTLVWRYRPILSDIEWSTPPTSERSGPLESKRTESRAARRRGRAWRELLYICSHSHYDC